VFARVHLCKHVILKGLGVAGVCRTHRRCRQKGSRGAGEDAEFARFIYERNIRTARSLATEMSLCGSQ
jgi:hypothetical protein